MQIGSESAIMKTTEPWFPTDGGPTYAETPAFIGHDQILIEPWNAFSSLLIVAPAIYFLIHLRGKYRENWFLVLCIPLLVLGGTGSTLFHAFRLSHFLLKLDVWPTALLFLAVSAYFWAKALKSWPFALVTMLLFFIATMGIYEFVPIGFRTNSAYLLRGLAFFVPVWITLKRTKFKEAGFIFGGVLAFALALFFRLIDHETISVLPMGTHFLWHAFTGLGGFLVAEYLLRVEANASLEKQT